MDHENENEGHWELSDSIKVIKEMTGVSMKLCNKFLKNQFQYVLPKDWKVPLIRSPSVHSSHTESHMVQYIWMN